MLACAEQSYPVCTSADELPLREDLPTWHGEIRAIFEARCAGCHAEGGIADLPFDQASTAAAHAASIAAAVTDRSMPPWPPADCCRPLEASLALPEDEIAAIVAWAEGGAPEGEEADYVAPTLESSGLSRVDLSLEMPEPYTPDPPEGETDDTRCFLLDWPESGTTWVTGLGVDPGIDAEVHHALVLIAGPTVVPTFEAYDYFDDGPGWSCPGGLVWGYTGWIGGWSPGWTARDMPEGTGQKVEEGSKLILTMHYSVPATDALPDQTRIDLRLDDEVEAGLRAISVFDSTWLAGGLDIPAGEEDVIHSTEAFSWQAATVYGVNLHMHERGSRGSVGVTHADGSTECLLQIDDWAHEWQGDYYFQTPFELRWDDSIWVECHWDNSAANQKVVAGEAEEPRDLNWAEDEEMCVAFLTARD